jgi:two-component sensor histidine kinase
MAANNDRSTNQSFFQMLNKRQFLKRLGMVLATWCGILPIYGFLYYGNHGVGDQINPLFALPIMVSGWLLGIWGGISSSTFAMMVIVLIAINTNGLAPGEISRQAPGIVIGLLSGIGSGWISSLWNQLRAQQVQLKTEIARRSEAQASLVDLNKHLEQIVASRTDELVRSSEKLAASLLERDILLKEIHHRVKNNLQIISSLLSLQAQKIQDRQIREAFRESQTRVRSMALIHEKLYRSETFAKISFDEYVRSLSSYLIQTYRASAGNIQLNVQCQAIFLDIDTAVPIGLILNELISNALKYAFPSDMTGEVSIALFTGEDQLCHLVVTDSGVGLPAGLDVSNVSSLGLQLVNNLVGQINGQLQVTNNGGLRYEIVFSIVG